MKNLSANTGDVGSILGSEDPLEKEMSTHPSILTWKVPWTEDPGGLLSTGSQRVGHQLVTKQHEFSKLGGRKITTEKSAAFPYTNNERA